MEIFINLIDLQNANLTPSLYCYLSTLYYSKEYPLANDFLKTKMNEKLQQLGFLKILEEGIILREKTNELFSKAPIQEDEIDTWIEEWRNLFPMGVKSGNRPVRGDLKGIITKMKAFIKQNPKVTKNQIMTATKQYVFDSSLGSYKYMICADYFIVKNGSSMLGAMIEDIEVKGSTLRNIEQGGGSSWHTEI